MPSPCPLAAAVPSRPCPRRARPPCAAGRCRSDSSRGLAVVPEVLHRRRDRRSAAADQLEQDVLRVALGGMRRARRRRTGRRRRAGCSRPSGTSRCGYARPPPGSRTAMLGISNGMSTSPMPSSNGRLVLRVRREGRDDASARRCGAARRSTLPLVSRPASMRSTETVW